MPDKDREQLYASRFLSVLLGKTSVPLASGEKPDFSATIGAKSVGIEITLFAPERESEKNAALEQAGLQNQVMDRARRLYEARGGMPRRISVMFSPYRPLSKASRNKVAERIVHLLLSDNRELMLWQEPDTAFPTADTPSPEIHSLHAESLPASHASEWAHARVAWVSRCSHEAIHAIIAAKRAKANAYRRDHDELWLLIVFDTVGGGHGVYPPTDSLRCNATTPFSRIFLFDYASETVQEVLAHGVA